MNPGDGFDKALRDSSERWRAILEHSSDIVTVIDATGHVSFSSSAAHLFGIPPEDAVGTGMFDWLDPEETERVAALFADILATPGIHPPVEVKTHDADGALHWVEAVPINLLDDPLVEGIVVHTRDISDRKEAELALRESEERWRRLLEHSSDLISVLDAKGALKFTSSATARFGVTPEEAAGTTIFDWLDPAEEERVAALLAEVAATPGIYPALEIRIQDGAGQPRWVEVVPINLLDDPYIAGIVVHTRDITERKEAELALRQSEERFRLVIERASDIISIFGRNGEAQYISPAAAGMFGAGPFPPTVRDALQLVHPEDRGEVVRAMNQSMAGDRPVEPFRYRLQDSEGHWRYFESTVTDLYDVPAVQGYLVVTRDISERERARHSRVVDALISELVMGEVEPSSLAQALTVGLRHASEYQVFVTRLERADWALSDSARSRLAPEIEDIVPGAIWGYFGAIGILITPALQGDERTLANEVCALLARYLPPGEVRIAVGPTAEGLGGLKASLEEAVRLLSFAEKAKAEGVITREAVLVPGLLHAAPELAGSLIELLQPLVAGEGRRNDLLATLRAYLEHDLSVQAAAHALSLHRNTVLRRLRRIEALLGGPVAEKRLLLELALAARDFQG